MFHRAGATEEKALLLDPPGRNIGANGVRGMHAEEHASSVGTGGAG